MNKMVKESMLLNAQVSHNHLKLLRDSCHTVMKLDELKRDVELLALCRSLDYDLSRAAISLNIMVKNLEKIKGV